MKTSTLNGKTALVTGASSGLGVDFARQLAQMGMNLVLVARREERLNQVGEELKSLYPIQVHTIPLDLASPSAPTELFQKTTDLHLQIELLVNNAGFGLYGSHASLSWEREQAMLQLDILTVAQLTRLYLNEMLKRDSGYILLISSVAAYQPLPLFAAYGAAKSYILHYGEALNYELRKTGVGVTVLSPGITQTDFFRNAGQHGTTFYQRAVMMQSQQAVRVGLQALLRRQPSVVPGFLNSFIAWGAGVIPRPMATWLGYLFMSQGEKPE